MKKIFIIIFLGVFFLAPIAVSAADYRSCCVCFRPAQTGVEKSTYSLPAGSTKENLITDAGTCDTHDASPVDCSIQSSEECGEAVAATPEMTNLADEMGLQNIVLGVAIPNLHFSAPPTKVDEEGNIYIPWAGEYVKAIYNFAVVVISILAVVVLILSGAQIITSAGGPAKGAAYKRITQAVIGLFIAWGSYVVLYTINPGLTTFNSLKIKYIEENVFKFEETGQDAEPPTAGTPQPALKKVAEEVASKLGINACLFQAQIGFESKWIPTAVTGCCAGLGQVMISNAKGYLNDPAKREKVISLHSEGCPKCPANGSSTEEVTNWLTGDPEGNLIVAGIIRKNALDSSKGNPLVAAAKYGMGGSYNVWGKVSGCKPAPLDTDGLFAKIKAGVTKEQLVADACIPPPTMALQNKAKRAICEGSYLCCEPGTESTIESCKQAKVERNSAGLNMGRGGVCGPGKDAGKKCWGIAGSASYIQHYVTAVSKCVK